MLETVLLLRAQNAFACTVSVRRQIVPPLKGLRLPIAEIPLGKVPHTQDGSRVRGQRKWQQPVDQQTHGALWTGAFMSNRF